LKKKGIVLVRKIPAKIQVTKRGNFRPDKEINVLIPPVNN
jgi:hypothetical protein